MYVACMLYVCILMIQVGRARPWARRRASLAAAVPGHGCTVIAAAVTRTWTCVTLIAVQVEHST